MFKWMFTNEYTKEKNWLSLSWFSSSGYKLVILDMVRERERKRRLITP